MVRGHLVRARREPEVSHTASGKTHAASATGSGRKVGCARYVNTLQDSSLVSSETFRHPRSK